MAGKPSWTLDPLDPRAPSLEVRSRMTAAELIARLEAMTEAAERATEEAQRGRDEAERRAERLARRLRDLGVDPDDET